MRDVYKRPQLEQRMRAPSCSTATNDHHLGGSKIIIELTGTTMMPLEAAKLMTAFTSAKV